MNVRAEARRRGAAQRAAQGLPELITDPLIMRSASVALASAVADSPRGPATADGGSASGAASPREYVGSLGKCADVDGRSASRRLAAPTTERGGRRQPTSSLTAAR